MLQDPLTLYKLIILYMLDQVDFPLPTSEVNNFLMGKDYAGFMPLLQAISDLAETGMVSTDTINKRPYLSITEEGAQTLRYFGGRISDAIKQEIRDYLGEQKMDLRDRIAVQGNYYKSTSGEYEARLTAWDREVKLLDITLSVPDEKAAAAICDNWQEKNESIYQYLIQELL